MSCKHNILSLNRAYNACITKGIVRPTEPSAEQEHRQRAEHVKPIYRGILCFSALLSAQNLIAAEPPRLIFEAPDSLAPLAARLSEVNPHRFRSAMQLTGLDHPGPPIRVILAPETSTVARRAPAWASGFAVSRANTIVIMPERVHAYPYHSLEAVLAHEVAHIMIARSARGRPVPRWFDEGLAMVAAHTWGLEDRARLVWAMVAGRPIPFDELDRLFNRDGASAQRAYVLAAALVQYILRNSGQSTPREILALLARGVPFDKAFTQVTSLTLAEVETAFWAHQTMWSRWVPVATSSAMLWLAITLLALYAYRRRQKHAVAVRRRWEEEDLEP